MAFNHKTKEQDKRKNQRRKAKMNSDNNNNRTNPIVTSKILLPTELETAISPKPFLATRTEVMRSGIDVPAARNVNPMTSGGTSKFSPTVMTDETRETRREGNKRRRRELRHMKSTHKVKKSETRKQTTSKTRYIMEIERKRHSPRVAHQTMR